ncbi:MAG: hypothetical protein S4CHLAM20_14330 [Chlamydiia bacterium]|nr:hypothetical protein [Chlamydiia bacterium]
MICLFILLSLGSIFASESSMTKEERVIVGANSQENPRLPQFNGLNTGFIYKNFDKAKLKQELKELNPNYSPQELFSQKIWDIDYYNKVNFPVIVGELEDKRAFSSQLKGHGLRFLDLPIHMPKQGWRIPPQLEQFKEVIAKAVLCEKLINPTFEKTCYVYITVDQGIVEPHVSQRRSGWHGDSYRKIDTRKTSLKIPVDHVYVVADCCPTLFVPGPFSLNSIDPENIDEVLTTFSSIANTQEAITYPNYTLLKMDPYCVHDAGINKTDHALHRTFVKISISQSKYCKLGNAHNQLFVYDWPMVPRHKVPYSPEAIKQSSHRKDRDLYQEVNVEQIDFLNDSCFLPWVKPTIYNIVRKGEVQAEKARVGDMLETKLDDFLITIWVAKENQWKVSYSGGYEVFTDDHIFKTIYKPDPIREGFFIPKCEIRRAIELNQDVRFYANYGGLEYGKKGDMIIYLNSDDIYIVPKKLFEKKFRIL